MVAVNQLPHRRQLRAVRVGLPCEGLQLVLRPLDLQVRQRHVLVDMGELVPDELEAVVEVVRQEVVDLAEALVVVVEPVLRLHRIDEGRRGDRHDDRVDRIAHDHVDQVHLGQQAAALVDLLVELAELVLQLVLGRERLLLDQGDIPLRALDAGLQQLVLPLRGLHALLLLDHPLAEEARLVRDPALAEVLQALDRHRPRPDLVVLPQVLPQPVVLVAVLVEALQLAVEPHRLLVERRRHEVRPGDAAVGRELLVAAAREGAPDHLVEVLHLLEERLRPEVVLRDGVLHPASVVCLRTRHHERRPLDLAGLLRLLGLLLLLQLVLLVLDGRQVLPEGVLPADHPLQRLDLLHDGQAPHVLRLVRRLHVVLRLEVVVEPDERRHLPHRLRQALAVGPELVQAVRTVLEADDLLHELDDEGQAWTHERGPAVEDVPVPVLDAVVVVVAVVLDRLLPLRGREDRRGAWDRLRAEVALDAVRHADIQVRAEEGLPLVVVDHVPLDVALQRVELVARERAELVDQPLHRLVGDEDPLELLRSDDEIVHFKISQSIWNWNLFGEKKKDAR